MPFYHRYNQSGGRPLILEILADDTETLTELDILNLESGEADLGATNDTAFLGGLVSAVLPTSYVAGTPGSIAAVASVTKLRVIVNPDAIYGIADANARLMGDTLDIAGATGAMTIAATSNADFIIAAPSGANEETLVVFTQAETWMF
jgi:hypothetical protein